MKMDNLAPEDARDWFVTVVGLATAGFFAYSTFAEIAPWYANYVGILVGLYLMLPRRMQGVGDKVANLIKKVRP